MRTFFFAPSLGRADGQPVQQFTSTDPGWANVQLMDRVLYADVVGRLPGAEPPLWVGIVQSRSWRVTGPGAEAELHIWAQREEPT